ATGKDGSRVQQEVLVGENGQLQKKKKRNRPKKKRGKGGGGGCVGGDRGAASAATANGAPASAVENMLDAPSKRNQKQKQSARPPQQQQGQHCNDQQNRHKGDQRHYQHAPSKPAQRQLSDVPASTRPEAPYNITANAVKNIDGVTSATTKWTRSKAETEGASIDMDNGINEEVAKTKRVAIATEGVEGVAVDEDMAKMVDSMAKGIAPFESSWTIAPDDRYSDTDSKYTSQGKRPTDTATDEQINTLARPKTNESNGSDSEESYLSFQGAEHSNSESQRPEEPMPVTPDTNDPHQAIADKQVQRTGGTAITAGQAGNGGDQVGQHAGENNPTGTPKECSPIHSSRNLSSDISCGFEVANAHDSDHSKKKGVDNEVTDITLTGAPALAQRIIAEANACQYPSFTENERPNESVSGAHILEEQPEVIVPNIVPQTHERDRYGEQNQGIICKGHSGAQRPKECGKAVLPNTERLPPQATPIESRRVQFAADVQEDRGPAAGASVGRYSARNEKDEDGEDALLLPDTSDSPKKQTEEGGHSDGRQGKDSSDKPQLPPDQERKSPETTVEEELVVDDVDDESSILLDPSPIAGASFTESTSKSTPTFGDAAGEPPPSPSPSSSLSSTAAAIYLRSTAVGKGATAPPALAQAHVAVSVSPAPSPSPAPSSKTALAAAKETTAAETYNYYELPPVPEQTTGEEKPTAKHSASLGGIWAAVRSSDAAGVRANLAAGAVMDEADSEGRTPLMVACANGDTEMASLLINGVSPPSSVAARTIEGWTPLMIASGGGRLGVVKVLLQAGAALHDKDDEFGSNSFMWACGGGHAEVARLMLENGAKELLHSTNSDMWTALMVACDAGSLETVQVLVEAGADLGTFNSEALTALDIAAGRNHLLVECYLRTEGAVSSTQFWTAADSGNVEIMSKLLRGNGHLVAALDPDGRTALLRSCVGGHLGVARILVEAGADVDFRDSSGTSALSVSVVLGDMTLTRYLVQAGGARLAVKNEAGWTPLMQAVVKGDLIMTRYLVDRGAAVNDGSPGGESVLDMARRFSGPELQRYLAAKGGFSSYEVERQIGEVNDGGRGLFRFW
ncbi:unnamed protein product, partial [Pylaiella littoralis]